MAPADGQTALLACRHCGEPLREGAPPGYCCEGCAAAAAWIEGSGLGAYYRLREGPAPRVEAQADLSAWDRADLQAAWVEPVGAGRRATLAVDGMHCAACAWLIDKALRREPGVLEVRANVLTARVRVDYDPAAVPLSVLVRRIAALGYRPSRSRQASAGCAPARASIREAEACRARRSKWRAISMKNTNITAASNQTSGPSRTVSSTEPPQAISTELPIRVSMPGERSFISFQKPIRKGAPA